MHFLSWYKKMEKPRFDMDFQMKTSLPNRYHSSMCLEKNNIYDILMMCLFGLSTIFEAFPVTFIFDVTFQQYSFFLEKPAGKPKE